MNLISSVKDMSESLSKNGFLKTLFGAFMTGFVSYAMVLIMNPSSMFEKFNDYQAKQHSESMARRMEITPIITEYLKQMVLELNCRRACVIEFHNGKNNAAGLSFIYGSMTYEAKQNDADSVLEDYAEFSLDRFPFIIECFKTGYWYGSVEDLKDIDMRLYHRLKSNGANTFAAQKVYGSTDDIGIMIVSYGPEDPEPDPVKTKEAMMRYERKVSIKLDGKIKTNRDTWSKY